jgi:methylenetetrahydrofolate reductase (NADPH)
MTIMTRQPAPGASFGNALKSGSFVVTAEISPPVSFDRADLLAKALPLKGLADAVNVTDGAGAHAHMGAGFAAATLAAHGIEPILQMTCRDRNRIALQSDLIGAASAGIGNILILRGDDPKKGDQPDAKPVFDLDTVALATIAAGMRDRGELPTGRKIAGHADFVIGIADMPVDPKPGWTPAALQAKIDAGAVFAQTQFCMDTGVVRRYAAALADHGIPKSVRLLVGVVPLRSAKSAHWIRNNLFGSIIPDAIVQRMEKASDPIAEGERICLEVLHELKEIPGVSGAHIMAPGRDEAVPGIIAQLRAAMREPAAKA